MPYQKGIAAADGFALRLALFYAGYFVFAGIQLPFLPVWLESRGLDPREIGFVLAVSMVARPLVVPFATRLADRRGVLREPLTIAVVAAAAAFAVVGVSRGFIGILLAYAVASLAQTVILPFADAYALRGLTERGRSYGPVRLWGSVSFIVANLAGGLLLQAFGGRDVIWALVAALVASAGIAAMLRPLSRQGVRPEPGTPAPSLWGSSAFIAVVAAASLIQSSHAVLHGFATLQWTARGLGGPAIGALWGIGVVAEIVLFAVSGRILARITPIEMIALGAVGAVVRWSAMAFDPPALLLPPLQCLHAFSFGATHIGSMQVLARLAAHRHGATAQGDFATVLALVFAAAMGLSGVLVEAFGSLAYLTMGAAAAAGGIIAVAARPHWRDAAPS